MKEKSIQIEACSNAAVSAFARVSCNRRAGTATQRRGYIYVMLLLAFVAAAPVGAESEIPERKPRIEVCFVLDTTGSMSGLIEGAKQKIWSIANELVSAKPTPKLKLSLIGYRDRGDQYMIKSFPLTDDIDAIYANLRGFEADGGGDTPESVNEALAEAIEKTAWSKDRDVLKIIFLVGDAPPHMNYPNEKKYPELCRLAATKDLIINTVQCGSISETAPIWKEIAKLAEGSYAAIAQSGNMAVVSTPLDEKLAELNKRMGATLIPYGNRETQREIREKQAMAESAPAPAAADRLSYNARTNKSVQGPGELLDALARNEVGLDSIKREQLPAELQKLDAAALKDRITKTRTEREQIQKEITELSKERDAYIQKETKRLAAAGNGDRFDENVAETIRRQAERKGIDYGR